MTASGSAFMRGGGTPPAEHPQAFEIGAIMPMTGRGAYYGAPDAAAIRSAADEIDATGGIGGVKLEIIIDDNRSVTPKHLCPPSSE